LTVKELGWHVPYPESVPGVWVLIKDQFWGSRHQVIFRNEPGDTAVAFKDGRPIEWNVKN
jgi:hypothetical protein